MRLQSLQRIKQQTVVFAVYRAIDCVLAVHQAIDCRVCNISSKIPVVKVHQAINCDVNSALSNETVTSTVH